MTSVGTFVLPECFLFEFFALALFANMLDCLVCACMYMCVPVCMCECVCVGV